MAAPLLHPQPPKTADGGGGGGDAAGGDPAFGKGGEPEQSAELQIKWDLVKFVLFCLGKCCWDHISFGAAPNPAQG